MTGAASSSTASSSSRTAPGRSKSVKASPSRRARRFRISTPTTSRSSPALAERGVSAQPAVWDDPAVDWAAFDLVVLRSTWDYAERRDAFLTWASSLERVVNRVPVLEWSSDKARYLVDLRAADVPIVPTSFVASRRAPDPRGRPLRRQAVDLCWRANVRAVRRGRGRCGRSARRTDTRRWPGGDGAAVRRRRGALTRLRRWGVLPRAFAASAASDGPRAPGALPRRAARARRRDFTAERAVADAAIACSPEPTLYGRVDLLAGAVLELELVEPSLYLGYGYGAVERFADAIAEALS